MILSRQSSGRKKMASEEARSKDSAFCYFRDFSENNNFFPDPERIFFSQVAKPKPRLISGEARIPAKRAGLRKSPRNNRRTIVEPFQQKELKKILNVVELERAQIFLA